MTSSAGWLVKVAAVVDKHAQPVAHAVTIIPQASLDAMNRLPEDDERHYLHLLTMLTVSTAMIGVCITTIGLLGILKSLNQTEWFIEEMLSISSLMFLATTLLSFVGMRTRLRHIYPKLFTATDVIFCLGLGFVFVATALLAWMVI